MCDGEHGSNATSDTHTHRPVVCFADAQSGKPGDEIRDAYYTDTKRADYVPLGDSRTDYASVVAVRLARQRDQSGIWPVLFVRQHSAANGSRLFALLEIAGTAAGFRFVSGSGYDKVRE